MEQIKTILIKITIGRKKMLEQAQIDGGRFQEGCGEENWGGCGYGEGESEGEGEGVGGEVLQSLYFQKVWQIYFVNF